jgi:hypothetical protein
MPRKRLRDMFPQGGNILTTIPYQTPVLIQLNKGNSKADTRHDIPSPMTNGFLTTVLNLVYGENIQIEPGSVYTDYPASNDIFTNGIKSQVASFQLGENLSFMFQANPYLLPLSCGPIPKSKSSSIKYFMRTLDTGRELLQGAETKVVVVADNVSRDAVNRTIAQSRNFLNKVNSNPNPVNINETVTLASIVDMAGKSVPNNWTQVFDTWWNDCVDRNKISFGIDLTAIGAVNIGGTGLVIERSTEQERIAGNNSLTVGIVVNGGDRLNIRYNLNAVSLEQSILRDPTGEYIFVSGKNIAFVFFQEYYNLLITDRGVDYRRIIHMVAQAVASATGLPYDYVQPHVVNIFNTLGNDYEVIGIYFIIGKLIGDLLCPLCCDNKWYTLTNDNLLISRCLLLYKRALFSKHTKQFSGFYFFVPEDPPDAQAAAVAQRNQTLTDRIRVDKLSTKRLELLVEEKIKALNNYIHIKVRRYGDSPDELKIIKMHKYFCEVQIRDAFFKFLDDEITQETAIDKINRISRLIITDTKHRRLLTKLMRDLGDQHEGGAPTPTTIIIKWNKKVFDFDPVDLSDSVSVLKAQLYSLTGVAPNKQKLILGGKTLKDDQSLESSGVKQGSVLKMIGNASETLVKPDMKVNFVDDLSTSVQATDNNPNERVLNICGGYAVCVTDVYTREIGNINNILEINTRQRNFIFGIGSQPIIGVPPDAKNFIESLKLFLEKVIQKLESKDEQYILQIFGDIISHLENILSITIPIIFQLNDDIIFPFCIDYDKVSNVCLLLGINADEFSIEDFKSKFEKFKSLFPGNTERILPIADIPTIVRNLVTSILEKTIPTEALPSIYGLLKGENLETILSNNKDNINNLYFEAIPEVLGIMNSYGVFTEAEEVETYIIRAIIENKNKDSSEHEIITKSIYSLYQNITVLYGIYVYDTEILKTFIENIKLQNNMIQYDGGFNSLQTIIDYRCDTEFETMIKDTTTYVSLNQFMQQQEQKIKELEQIEQQEQIRQPLDPMGLREVNQTNQFKGELSVTNGGNNNHKSKHNAKYRKKYKKFVSKYIIKKKKNKSTTSISTKNKTRKNKRLAKTKPKSKYAKKTLKNKKRKSKSKSSNNKSKHNNKAKTNYYNLYKHNKTLKH